MANSSSDNSPGKIVRRKKRGEITNDSGTLAKIRSSQIKGTSKESLPSKTKLQETVNRSREKQSLMRVIFSFDATASRSHFWDISQEITAGMFENIPPELEIALAYHQGNAHTLGHFGKDRNEFFQELNKVQPVPGLTKFNEILREAIELPRVKSLIYIGDCYEESIETGLGLAQQLALKNTKVFVFHDSMGDENERAKRNLGEIARATSGALFNFDTNSPTLIQQILQAIIFYSSSGGIKKVKTLKTPGARLFLQAVSE